MRRPRYISRRAKNPDSTEVDKSKLEKFQPAPFKVSTITKEQVNVVSTLPGNVVPLKDITPRCSDANIKKNKRTCRNLRFKGTEVNLGGMYKNWRACNWQRIKGRGRRTCVARATIVACSNRSISAQNSATLLGAFGRKENAKKTMDVVCNNVASHSATVINGNVA